MATDPFLNFADRFIRSQIVGAQLRQQDEAERRREGRYERQLELQAESLGLSGRRLHETERSNRARERFIAGTAQTKAGVGIDPDADFTDIFDRAAAPFRQGGFGKFARGKFTAGSLPQIWEAVRSSMLASKEGRQMDEQQWAEISNRFKRHFAKESGIETFDFGAQGAVQLQQGIGGTNVPLGPTSGTGAAVTPLGGTPTTTPAGLGTSVFGTPGDTAASASFGAIGRPSMNLSFDGGDPFPSAGARTGPSFAPTFLPSFSEPEAVKTRIGSLVEKAGKKFRITGFDDDGEPLVVPSLN